MQTDIWSIPHSTPLAEARDILVMNGMFRNEPLSGSDAEENRYESAEVKEHQKNLIRAIDFEQAVSLHEGSPEEFPRPEDKE